MQRMGGNIRRISLKRMFLIREVPLDFLLLVQSLRSRITGMREQWRVKAVR